MSAKSDNTFFKQWGVLGLALMLLCGAVIHNLYNGYRDTETIEQQRLGTQARIVSENIADEMKITDRVLRAIRAELGFIPAQRWNTVVDAGRLKQLEDVIPGVRTFLGVDRNGQVRFSSRRELVGTNVAYREYFKKAQDNATDDILFVSPPFKTVLGIWGIPLIRTLTGSDGKFNGIVVATLDPANFTTLLSTVNYSRDMITAIIHGDGLLFSMAPEWKELSGKNLSLPGTLFSDHMASGKLENLFSGLFHATGDQRMLAFRTVRVRRTERTVPSYLVRGCRTETV